MSETRSQTQTPNSTLPPAQGAANITLNLPTSALTDGKSHSVNVSLISAMVVFLAVQACFIYTLKSDISLADAVCTFLNSNQIKKEVQEISVVHLPGVVANIKNDTSSTCTDVCSRISEDLRTNVTLESRVARESCANETRKLVTDFGVLLLRKANSPEEFDAPKEVHNIFRRANAEARAESQEALVKILKLERDLAVCDKNLTDTKERLAFETNVVNKLTTRLSVGMVIQFLKQDPFATGFIMLAWITADFVFWLEKIQYLWFIMPLAVFVFGLVGTKVIKPMREKKTKSTTTSTSLKTALSQSENDMIAAALAAADENSQDPGPKAIGAM